MSNIGLPMGPPQPKRKRTKKAESRPRQSAQPTPVPAGSGGGSGGSGRPPKPPRQPKARKPGGLRLGPALIAAVAACLLVALGAGFYASKYFITPDAPDYAGDGTGQVQVVIPAGATVADIGRVLNEAGVTASTQAFINAASDSDQGTSVQPGTYNLHSQMSASSAIALLLDPSAKLLTTFTIPEGTRLDKVIKIASTATNIPLSFVVSIFINIGMWFERFNIIVTSLHRDYLPASWASYRPTSVEISTLIGSFGLFFTLFLVFCRLLPVIAMAEIKGVLKHGVDHGEAGR